jgi:hypothetical protein
MTDHHHRPWRTPVGLAGAVALALLGGCADLGSVRDLADETRKITVAFDPFLAGAVTQCEQKFIQRRVYAGAGPIKGFDAQKVSDEAKALCKPIAQKNATARQINTALAAYAAALSAIAGDGVALSLNDGLGDLSDKLGSFAEMPARQFGAVEGLVKFLARAALTRQQKSAIEEALSHREAVGALADALVLYADRVYGAYVRESDDDLGLFSDGLRDGSTPELLARLQLMELRRQQLQLHAQLKTVAALRLSVDEMKLTMADLQAHLGELGTAERKQQVLKLAQEVKTLSVQVQHAFKG